MSGDYWREIEANYGRWEAYSGYMKSREWKRKTWGVWERAKRKCEYCGVADGLAVHHLTYEHLFDEPLEDLVLLCRDCHSTLHGTEAA